MPPAPTDPMAVGIRLFNRQEFHRTHQRWEEAWLTATGSRRTILQGLIQVAAACWHLQRGRWRPAVILLDRARPKLDLPAAGPVGVDLEALQHDLMRLRFLAAERTHGQMSRPWRDDEFPRLRPG